MAKGMNINVGVKGLKKDTNILNVTVPDALRRRVKSGIDWFDAAIGGQGFVPSTVMMLTGTPGAGKTTMLMQLADALTAAGNIVLLNTTEESVYQVAMVAERLRLQHGFVVGQDELATDIVKHADALAKANPGKQVVLLVDSLQSIDDGKWNGAINSMTPVRCTEVFVDWAKKTNAIVVFIGQVNKDGVFNGKNTILHAVDIKGHIFIDEGKNSETFGERLFEVTKNRFGCSGITIVLGIEKTGLFEKGSFKKGE
jgi:DNA repair protein RadA/Sms